MNTIVISATLHDVPDNLDEADLMASLLESAIVRLCDEYTSQRTRNGPHAQVYAGVRSG